MADVWPSLSLGASFWLSTARCGMYQSNELITKTRVRHWSGLARWPRTYRQNANNLRYAKKVDVVEQDIDFSVLASEDNHVTSVFYSLTGSLLLLGLALIDVCQSKVSTKFFKNCGSWWFVNGSRVSIALRRAELALIFELEPLTRGGTHLIDCAALDLKEKTSRWSD